jgi:hypothetical protein
MGQNSRPGCEAQTSCSSFLERPSQMTEDSDAPFATRPASVASLKREGDPIETQDYSPPLNHCLTSREGVERLHG